MVLVLSAGAITALSLILRAHVPITVAGEPVDDLLFTRLATFLAHGQWLGPFDQLTLVKGPAYPAFIAAMYRSGLPLMIGEQLTYLLASAAMAGCVWVVMRRGIIALAVYGVLAFDPVNFSTYGSRLIRDGWYSSICMLFVATFFLAVYGAVTGGRLLWVVPVAVVSGASGAAFWLGREEGVWMIPTLCVIAVGLPSYRLARWWFAKPRTRPGRRRILAAAGRVCLVWAVVAVALIAPVVAVSRSNASHYGVALTNDLESGRFAAAYADWRRVKAGTPTLDDPITRSQREAVYQVSSAARQLQPYLDPSRPCVGSMPCTKHIWLALRDSAARAGYYRSESDAQAFFGELDAQIQAGCASGQLSCSPRLPSELQPLQSFSLGPLLSYVGLWGGRTVVSSGFYDLPFKHKPTSPSKRAVYVPIISGVPVAQVAADAQVGRFLSNDWPYRLLSWAYRLLIPCLLALSMASLVWSFVRRRWPQLALAIFSLALLVGFVVRLIFVGLLATTQFPTVGTDVRYLLSAHTLLLSFGVVGSALLFDLLKARRVVPQAGSADEGDGADLFADPPSPTSTDPALSPLGLLREDGRVDEGDGLENR